MEMVFGFFNILTFVLNFQELGTHETSGIDMTVTNERVILLDTQVNTHGYFS